MARAKDEVERRARAISLVWKAETGHFAPPKFCRKYAEMAFACGDVPGIDAARDFLSQLRAKLRELRALGMEPKLIDSPAINRMAEDLHHSEVKRASLGRSGAVAQQLARLAHDKEER